MFGKNPKRAIVKGDGSLLHIQEIFPTVQGEGPHTGVPSVFIRLNGCNLACEFCDTEFEDFQEHDLDDVLQTVENFSADGRKLVVITGGEPMRQNIAPLCQALLEEDYQPQIETNGTLWRELPQGVDIICSPKNTGNAYHPIRPDLAARVTAYKFIISKNLPAYQTVPNFDHTAPVWVQPMDEYDALKNQQNLDYTLQLAAENNYKISLQTHKLFKIA